MYKKASQQKLKFTTPKGNLNVEQIWDLTFKDLTTSIKEAKKVLSQTSDDDDLSFLETESTVNVEHKLIFDILKDVYITKREEKDAILNESKVKEHNEKILAKIYAKQEEALDNLSEEELRSQLM